MGAASVKVGCLGVFFGLFQGNVPIPCLDAPPSNMVDVETKLTNEYMNTEYSEYRIVEYDGELHNY